MKNESLIAQRLVYDAVNLAGGPIQFVQNGKITRTLLQYARTSHQRYHESLAAKSDIEKNQSGVEQERKRKQQQFDEVEEKRRNLLAEYKFQAHECDKQLQQLRENL